MSSINNQPPVTEGYAINDKGETIFIESSEPKKRGRVIWEVSVNVKDLPETGLYHQNPFATEEDISPKEGT